MLKWIVITIIAVVLTVCGMSSYAKSSSFSSSSRSATSYSKPSVSSSPKPKPLFRKSEVKKPATKTVKRPLEFYTIIPQANGVAEIECERTVTGMYHCVEDD